MRKLFFFFLLFFYSCTGLFFYPDKRQYINPNLIGYKREDVFFKSLDNINLHAWLFTSKENKGTVIFLHGNAENITTHVNSVLWLIDRGYNVFAFDYRGYGKSEGITTLKGVHIDAESAIRYVLEREEISKNIILFGQSLGGAIAITNLANSSYKDKINCLIVESTFAGYRRIAKDKIAKNIFTKIFGYPLIFLINDDYSPERFIDKISPTPVLILHGDEDDIVPAYHGDLLFKIAKDPKELIIKRARHINVSRHQDVREKILNFLEKSLKK
ncbi:MAG: alpha/beta hydrolase [Proteobacteria bacterium]|nr:alpha/beta hydrolase [Pseudomonadota bacterium]